MFAAYTVMIMIMKQNRQPFSDMMGHSWHLRMQGSDLYGNLELSVWPIGHTNNMHNIKMTKMSI